MFQVCQILFWIVRFKLKNQHNHFYFFIFGPVSAQLEVDKDAKTASFPLLLVIDHYSGVVRGQGQANGAGSLTQQSSSTTPGICLQCGCCFALIPLYICF